MPRSRRRDREHALPTMMQAAAIDRFGPPSVIRIHTLPVPRPGPREVLVALEAAGVGSWDESVRDGSWKPGGRTKFPLVLGTDGAGVVVAKGARVRRFRVGDRAYGYEPFNAKGGFYTEYIAIDEKSLGLVPRRLDLLHAGAGAVTALTAQQGIDRALGVRRGETVLIFGASGAVGTLAVQFAKRHRTRVLATASGRAYPNGIEPEPKPRPLECVAKLAVPRVLPANSPTWCSPQSACLTSHFENFAGNCLMIPSDNASAIARMCA